MKAKGMNLWMLKGADPRTAVETAPAIQDAEQLAAVSQMR